MSQITELDRIKFDFDLLAYILDTHETELKTIQRSKGRIDLSICPKCGGKGHFSVYTSDDKEDTFSTFTTNSGCFEKGGTIIDYIAGIEEISTQEAIRKVQTTYDFDDSGKYKKSSQNEYQPVKKKASRGNSSSGYTPAGTEKQRQRMINLLTEAALIYHEQLKQYPDVKDWIINQWSINSETIDSELIGYAPSKLNISAALIEHGFTPDEVRQSGLITDKGNFFWNRIIFPYWLSGDTQKVAYMSGRQYKGDDDSGHKYIKLSTQAGLIENRYAIGAHRATGEKELLIVEGGFDYLSAISRGFHAVAAGSTKPSQAILMHLCQIAQKYQTIYIVFDTDSNGAGQAGAKELAINISKESIERYNRQLDIRIIELPYTDSTQKKQDIADFFKFAGAGDFIALKDSVKPFQQTIQEPEIYTANETTSTEVMSPGQHFNDRPILDYLDLFFEEVENRTRLQAISTGFKALDDKLDGGIYSGLYTIGAISSLGKTTLIHQIADNIAASGHPVRYYSLEMSRFEMVAKSLSRETYRIDSHRAAMTRSIMQGSYFNHDVLLKAHQNYKQSAKNLTIIEGMFTTTIETIERDIKRIKDMRAEKPLVIVDYLQILKSEIAEQRRYTERQTIDHIVSQLKRISRDFDIPIIAISSFNRANYSEVVALESFKESGAIEYTSDVILGLQLRIMEDASKQKTKSGQRIMVEQAKGIVREIELKCLKNRNGVANFTVDLSFNAKHNHFSETYFIK